MLRSSHDACGCSTQTTSTINLKRSTLHPTKGKPTGRIPHLTPLIMVRIQLPQPGIPFFRERLPSRGKVRVWRPSLRVIHLAVAALIIGTDHVRAGGTTAMETFLLAQLFIKAVVKEARVNEERIAKAARLPI